MRLNISPRERWGSDLAAEGAVVEVVSGAECLEESSERTSSTFCGSIIRFVRQFSRICELADQATTIR